MTHEAYRAESRSAELPTCDSPYDPATAPKDFGAETDDGAEGPRAFRERRKPQWRAR
jgi:hypothetical protein